MKTEWTLWVVENDPYQGGVDEFDIAGYVDFKQAYDSAVFELQDNPAAICVYISNVDTGNIWYILDGLTREGAYLEPGITSWREARKTIQESYVPEYSPYDFNPDAV